MDGVSRSKYVPKSVSSNVRTQTLGRIHGILEGDFIKVRVENLSERGPVEIPVRHVEESGCKFTFEGMEYTPAIVHCLLEYGLATKSEARWLSKFARICE